MISLNQSRSEWDDYDKRHAEFELRRAALRAEIAREKRAVDDLLKEVENWQKSKAIRAYIFAVEVSARRNNALEDIAPWIGWASDQADRFDPLSESLPSILDTPHDQYRELTLDEAFDDDGNIEHA